MRRITKKIYENQYILKDMGEFPLCVFLYSKQFRKERKLINKLGKIEDKMEEKDFTADVWEKLDEFYKKEIKNVNSNM